jgi:uncharacterized protein YndB with AHSA1/START domain
MAAPFCLWNESTLTSFGAAITGPGLIGIPGGSGGGGKVPPTDLPSLFLVVTGNLFRYGKRRYRMDDAQFTRIDSAFAMVCRVEVNIAAAAEIVWGLLVDAPGFPRWNSTVTRIDGEIVDGARIKIHVPGTARTFTPKVSGLLAQHQMTWSDGVAGIFRGVRTFRLQEPSDKTTDFMMEERFSGSYLHSPGRCCRISVPFLRATHTI